MPRRALAAVTLAAFIAGVGLMVPFEQAATRIAGVLCLLVFIVCGVFLVANPDDLAGSGDAGQEDGPRPR